MITYISFISNVIIKQSKSRVVPLVSILFFPNENVLLASFLFFVVGFTQFDAPKGFHTFNIKIFGLGFMREYVPVNFTLRASDS